MSETTSIVVLFCVVLLLAGLVALTVKRGMRLREVRTPGLIFIAVLLVVIVLQVTGG